MIIARLCTIWQCDQVHCSQVVPSAIYFRLVLLPREKSLTRFQLKIQWKEEVWPWFTRVMILRFHSDPLSASLVSHDSFLSYFMILRMTLTFSLLIFVGQLISCVCFFHCLNYLRYLLLTASLIGGWTPCVHCTPCPVLLCQKCMPVTQSLGQRMSWCHNGDHSRNNLAHWKWRSDLVLYIKRLLTLAVNFLTLAEPWWQRT